MARQIGLPAFDLDLLPAQPSKQGRQRQRDTSQGGAELVHVRKNAGAPVVQQQRLLGVPLGVRHPLP